VARGGFGGTSTGAHLDLDKHGMDIDQVVVGKSSVATFTLTNVGTVASDVAVVTVGFTANISNASDLTIDPNAPQSFVAVFMETTPPIVFTVANVSDTASGPVTSSIVGDYSWDFAISDTDCTTLAPHATGSISVVCSPGMSASSAPREVILSVTDGNTHLAVPLTTTISFEM